MFFFKRFQLMNVQCTLAFGGLFTLLYPTITAILNRKLPAVDTRGIYAAAMYTFKVYTSLLCFLNVLLDLMKNSISI